MLFRSQLPTVQEIQQQKRHTILSKSNVIFRATIIISIIILIAMFMGGVYFFSARNNQQFPKEIVQKEITIITSTPIPIRAPTQTSTAIPILTASSSVLYTYSDHN